MAKIKLQTLPCPECNKDNFVMVEPQDLQKWKGGMHIQDAFPYLTANERESFLTGICGTCWDKLFE